MDESSSGLCRLVVNVINGVEYLEFLETLVS